MAPSSPRRLDLAGELEASGRFHDWAAGLVLAGRGRHRPIDRGGRRWAHAGRPPTTSTAGISATVRSGPTTGRRSSSTGPASGSGRSPITSVRAAAPDRTHVAAWYWRRATSSRSGTSPRTTRGRSRRSRSTPARSAGDPRAGSARPGRQALGGDRAGGHGGRWNWRTALIRSCSDGGGAARQVDGQSGGGREPALDGGAVRAGSTGRSGVRGDPAADRGGPGRSPDGGVHRYAADTYYGGGAWLLLTAALGRVYLRRGGPADRAAAPRCLRWIERAGRARTARCPEQVATRALHPGADRRVAGDWGGSASPLLWSHATYLALLGGARVMAVAGGAAGAVRPRGRGSGPGGPRGGAGRGRRRRGAPSRPCRRAARRRARRAPARRGSGCGRPIRGPLGSTLPGARRTATGSSLVAVGWPGGRPRLLGGRGAWTAGGNHPATRR